MKTTGRVVSSVALLLTVLLYGCGGGGNDSTEATTTATAVGTFPIDAAIKNFLTTPHTFNATYTEPTSNDTYLLTYSARPGPDASFENQPAKTAVLATTLKKNGVAIETNTETAYFTVGPLKNLGTVLGTGEYEVATNSVLLPTSAKPGDLGPLAMSTTYSDSSKKSVIQTSVITWSLTADTASTAYLCVNSTEKKTNGNSETDSECYKIDTAGTILGNKLTITINGKSVVFTG